MFPKRRPYVRRLALTLLVLAGITLLLKPRGPVSSSGAAPRIASRAPLPAPAVTAAVVTDAKPEPAPAAAALPAAPAPALFSYLHPDNTEEMDAAMRAPAQKVFYVKLDQDLFWGSQSPFWQGPDQGRVSLPLPDGSVLTVVIHSSETLGAQRFTSTGTIQGRPNSRAILAYNEGYVHAEVEDVDLGSYELRAALTDGMEQFYHVDPSMIPGCGGEKIPVLDADAAATLAARATAHPSASVGLGVAMDQQDGSVAATPPVEAYSAGTNVVVHVMVLFTQGVRFGQAEPGRTAALQSDADADITQVNDDFARSKISARVKLVKMAQTTYVGDESSTAAANWQSDMLDALRGTTDTGPSAMNEIHALRDQVGADLVCLVQHRQDTTSAGIGYLINVPSAAINPLYGFSVVSDASGTQHSMSHELGHNFGCAHNRENTTSAGSYSYSYGYRFTGTNGSRYRDIMAYDIDNPTFLTTYTRLSYFSNPDVVPLNSLGASTGAAIGIAPGSTGEADNALTIDEGSFEVSTFRLQTQTVASAGTLVNVATRAFAGLGDQQLIAGFIISGTQPKKMLIRAAGPALIPFGVTGTLPDPKLTINRTDITTGNPIAVNATGWETQNNGTTATDIVNAVPGAFAFAHGSKDAALLVTLPPGNYTANVESVSGKTGVAIVEAYEVDRNGNKIVNLSTRAYCANGNEIFGGFVVQGDPGTTKRILIRARGPSLAQFGLNNPLLDPGLALYNSDSTLLMVNNDWTTGQGLTSEQQIAATGLAPGSAREPCLLVDLAPGLYTTLVVPYGSSPPGVAIIEVYEIQ